ncbi:MAG TPA: divergent polysaccharide deacetylase family protein [Rhizomicrobium sp.]|jgi:hypothetical protein
MALEGLSNDYETLTDPVPDRPSLLAWTSAILATLFAALCLMVVLFGDPHADRPSIDLAIDPIVHTNVVHTDWSHGVHSLKPGTREAVREELKRRPATIEQSEPGEKPRLIIRPIYAGSSLVADPALIENSAQGPLPRIADNGRTPIQAYGGNAPPAAKKPKIAIVMMGFGASGEATVTALGALPTAITVGFVPRGGDIQNWVNEARSRGHEVLLELPMEPYDYPDSDPGPHTLRTGQGEEANTHHLTWALTRFTGYAGVTNEQGGRFLSDSEALEPVMTFLARRGLMFYDDGSTAKSAVPDVAKQTNTAFARGALSIDHVQDSAAIDRALSDLETEARTKGSAVGTAFLYPVSVERLALWARGLSSRGFVLVPASAIVGKPK